jgi:ADP-ribose pyrophosphatase YjhB (NUDIX family)
MVRGWKAAASWSFPCGKINEGESPRDCAVREAYEEIGFDVATFLIESDYIEYEFKGRPVRLYIIQDISEDTPFGAQTKKEIGDIAWHSLAPISKKKLQTIKKRYFTSFIALLKLKAWIKQQRSLPIRLLPHDEPPLIPSSPELTLVADEPTNRSDSAPFLKRLFQEAQSKSSSNPSLFIASTHEEIRVLTTDSLGHLQE